MFGRIFKKNAGIANNANYRDFQFAVKAYFMRMYHTHVEVGAGMMLYNMDKSRSIYNEDYRVVQNEDESYSLISNY